MMSASDCLRELLERIAAGVGVDAGADVTALRRAVSYRLLLGRFAIPKEKSARRRRTPMKWPRVRASRNLATLFLTAGISPIYNSV
jgi:hypothetical protein